jgi:GntR family transcriptional repressor for pyruvate dehydrogenase complex
MLEPVERLKLNELVAMRIKDHIMTHKLKSGDRLPTEYALAEVFGVSRVSVREATKALEFLGIIEAAPRRGLRVGAVNMNRVSEYLGFHLAISDFPAEQLIETRIVIETGGLPQTIRIMKHDSDVYDQLNAINDQLRHARSLQSWIELDLAFHRALLDASGLQPLVAFGDLLQIFFQRFRESVKKGEWKEGIESHQRIIDSLKANRLKPACDELRRHVESHKSRMGAS